MRSIPNDQPRFDLLGPLYPHAGEGSPPIPAGILHQFMESVRDLEPLQRLRTLYHGWGISPTGSSWEQIVQVAIADLRQRHPELPTRLGDKDPSDKPTSPVHPRDRVTGQTANSVPFSATATFLGNGFIVR